MLGASNSATSSVNCKSVLDSQTFPNSMPSRRTPRKLGSEELWQHALSALGKRAHSARELRRKLAVRAESSAVLAEVIDKLREYNFLDDERFAESFASSRLDNQGYGSRRVLAELRSRQISGKIAEQAVQKLYRDTDEEQLAKQFLQRKYRGKDLTKLLGEQKNFLSAYRRLMAAGFTPRASITVLRQFASPSDDFAPAEPEPNE
jgi:regulatory protein